MSEIRKKIENRFESFGNLIYENRIKALIIMAVTVVAMASGLSKTRFDTSMEGFLHDDDPVLATYNAFRDQFGRDEMILLALQPPEIFEQGFLKTLQTLHQDLETNVPHLDEITSLINARSTRGEGDVLVVEDLLENWPQSAVEMETLRKRVLSNPLYKNLLISEDGRFTAVAIKTSTYSSASSDPGDLDEVDAALEGFGDEPPAGEKSEEPAYLTDQENKEVVEAVREVMARYSSPDFPIYIAGSPVVTNDLRRSMLRDARLFILMAGATMTVFLLILFRRVSGFVLPMTVVIMSLLSTVGLMGHFGIAIRLPTNVLPSFLIAVGVGDAVHILTIFYRRMAYGDNKKRAIAYALGHSGLAVVMTTMTTAAGLFSFSTAEVAPIADLGVFAGIGVLLAMVNTLVFLPAMLALVPLRDKKLTDHQQREGTFLDKLLAGIGDFATRHPIKIIVISSIILTIAIIGACRSKFTHNVLKWLPEDMEIRVSTEAIDRNLKGTTVLEVVVDTGEEDGLHDPWVLNRLEELKGHFESSQQYNLFVGKVTTVTDILKEIHQALNENNPEYYTVPQDTALIPQEFLIFENSGSDDLEDFVDTQFNQARFTLKVPWSDAIMYADFIRAVEKKFQEVFASRANITVTGLMNIMGRTLAAAIHSMAKSYVIAFVVITFFMILLIGNIRVGLVSMIPNLSPIIIALGIIGFTDIPLDMFTMLIGSIAIGLAVDDTIHFMHNFMRYRHETGDVRKAVHMTLQTTGRAMLFTSMVLSTGFFILMLSKMHNLQNFGLLTGIAIMLALIADFLLAPALMAVIYDNRKGK